MQNVKKYNPEQTIKKIVSISTTLFLEKGYDKTSMQDIVNELGMSKGAIFHHFKSKEDIFGAVVTNIAHEQMAEFKNLLDAKMKNLSAKDKLTQILSVGLNESENKVFKILSERATDPKVILGIMKFNMEISAPLLADIMREGIDDGSISTLYPNECAEVLLLLVNIWCEPAIFECDIQAFRKRVEYFQFLMKASGADIIDSVLLDKFIKIHRKYS